MEPATIPAPASLGDEAGRYVFENGFPKGRFRNRATGRFVSWDTIRGVLDESLVNAKARMTSEARRLQAGKITLADFQRFMEPEIKRVHLASAALERGGWGRMTPADYGRVGRALFNPNATANRATWGQYQFSRQFFADIAAGLPLDGNFIRRAGMYVDAGRKTYHRFERIGMQAQGFDEERFVLAPADHCTDADGALGGCTERAAAGWQPIGTYGNIGEMNCRTNDKCSVEYRKTTTGETWELA